MEPAVIADLNQQLKDLVAVYAKAKRLGFELLNPLNRHDVAEVVRLDDHRAQSGKFRELAGKFMMSLKNNAPADFVAAHSDFLEIDVNSWTQPGWSEVNSIKRIILRLVSDLAAKIPEAKLSYWDEIVDSNKLVRVFMENIYHTEHLKTQDDFFKAGLELRRVDDLCDTTKPEFWLWHDYLPTLQYTVRLISQSYQSAYEVDGMKCLAVVASGLTTGVLRSVHTDGGRPYELIEMSYSTRLAIRGAQWNHTTTLLLGMLEALNDRPAAQTQVCCPEFTQ